MATRLAASQVFVVDCQSTGSTPAHGHLIELGWARYRCGEDPAELDACVVALPDGAHVPRMVSQITGLDERRVQTGLPREAAWRGLDEAARRASDDRGVTPTVIHFASFEERFLRDLHESYDEPFPFRFDIVCTHAIARRLLPTLPRRSLRALAGYFGYSSSQLRRSRDHVEATCFVWRHLVRQLEEEEDVCTWEELREWLSGKAKRSKKHTYPMPRETRLGLPDTPGVYRFLRANGDLLYVGKATSLKKRVNSHFRKQAKQSERTLEMLTQARDIAYTEVATPLEAALLESDEIKRHQPPYNVALIEEGRSVWFGSRDLSKFAQQPDAEHPLGPFPSSHSLAGVSTLHRLLAADVSKDPHVYTRARALGIGPASSPESTLFLDGLALFRERHYDGDPAPAPSIRNLLSLARAIARRLELHPRPTRENEDEVVWDAQRVFEHIEESLARAPQLIARGRWLTHLADATVAFREPGQTDLRFVAIDGTQVSLADSLDGRTRGRDRTDRQAKFDILSYDRLRVLTTELKRIVRDGGEVRIRFGDRAILTEKAVEAALRAV